MDTLGWGPGAVLQEQSEAGTAQITPCHTHIHIQGKYYATCTILYRYTNRANNIKNQRRRIYVREAALIMTATPLLPLIQWENTCTDQIMGTNPYRACHPATSSILIHPSKHGTGYLHCMQHSGARHDGGQRRPRRHRTRRVPHNRHRPRITQAPLQRRHLCHQLCQLRLPVRRRRHQERVGGAGAQVHHRRHAQRQG